MHRSTTLRRMTGSALAVAALTGGLTVAAPVLAPTGGPLSAAQADAATPGQQQAIADVSVAQIGDDYSYGAAGPDAFDCSGFTSYVLRHAVGVEIPRTSQAQRDSLPYVAAGDAQVGDVVFFHGSNGGVYHTAIYAGNGRMWAASSSADAVREQSVYSSSVSYGRAV